MIVVMMWLSIKGHDAGIYTEQNYDAADNSAYNGLPNNFSKLPCGMTHRQQHGQGT